MFRRSRSQPLYGEVGDGMESQVHHLTLQVVFVDLAQKGLLGKLYDGLNEATGGLIFEKHQEWTESRGKMQLLVYFHEEFSSTKKQCVLSDLTPGAALRLVRYSMMRLRSSLQSLGRFL